MAVWPTITEPELLERLTLDDQAFAAFYARLADAAGRRAFSVESRDRAFAYPWARPAHSYLLRDTEVTLLPALAPATLAANLDELTGPTSGRTPLLAFGSNGAPSTLIRKFAHFPAPQDRRVLVLAGHLHDFDVGASAQPTMYGSLPATLFPSAGTAVRAAVLWVTQAQFTQLAWSELSYRLGRLRAEFVADEAGCSLDDLMAFVSRFGAFAPAGEPVALAAIPARDRVATALSQVEALDAAARMALGPDADAAALVQAVFEDFGALIPRLAATVRRAAQPFSSPGWTAFASA
jgi:hypothetical protein